MTSKWIMNGLSGAALIGLTLTSALPVSAESAPDNNGPGVARVSVVTGSAVVQRGDSHTQTTAVVNAPLLPGDYISTGSTSRAELQFDGETAVRLGGNVQARITNNDPNNRALQLADGTVEVGLVHSVQPFQVDTPSVSVRAQDPGDYRVTIAKDGATWVTVRHGHAQAITPDRTYDLSSGKTLVARGSASHPSISYTAEVGYDSFDEFSAKRDQTMIAAVSASPDVNPTIAGYDNLDQYGTWQDVGDAQAWVPNQSADWAPYQNGSWAWEGGYGWTWVGAEPWGWAPYHYGRWSYANGYGWAWYPPAYMAYSTPAWSPALVGFFGFGLSVGGPGWNVGVGFGSGYPGIGWYPLAPYAPYYPWYPGWAWSGFGWGWPVGFGGCCFPGFGSRVINITNINNFNNNRNFAHHGATGTLTGHFQHGDFSHNISVDPHNISRMGTIHGAVPVAPGKDNLAFGKSPSAAVTFSKDFDSPRFASNRALSARTPFEDQQRSVAGAIHASDSHQSAPVSRDSASRDTVSRDSANTEGARSANGRVDSWQRFNDSRGTPERESAMAPGSQRYQADRGSSGTETARSDRTANDSWSRFSQSRGSVAPSYSRNASNASNSRGEGYSRGSSESSYGRQSSYPSYAHQSSNPSYAHQSSYPSYAHESSYPSYAHESSYPSYAHQSSYPSTSRESSYPSNARGSAPSNARGSSEPAPHASGGSNRGGGAGRPPQ
jgi:hypothetical protein